MSEVSHVERTTRLTLLALTALALASLAGAVYLEAMTGHTPAWATAVLGLCGGGICSMVPTRPRANGPSADGPRSH